ncbi:MAG: aspartate carbamoyltransferase regulatory subunit, partial [Clostridia bacterium]|nr:aspartate carbamoyltransferase regulatory subunit [Clostridia bacterium]
MNIDSIVNGIVIDHIEAGKGMEIVRLLGLDSLDCQVAIIKNAHSSKMGKKDIIKVAADIPVNTDILGYVDPGVTVDVIRDGKLVDKKKMSLPKKLKGVIF